MHTTKITTFQVSSFQNNEVFQKVGNVLAFFAGRIPDLYITKLSKLLYILDELSIKEIGMPVTGLEYKVAQAGPLAANVWSSLRYNEGHFNQFIHVYAGVNWLKISQNPQFAFNENLFTEFELELLENVVKNFGEMNTEKLIDYTHSASSPWHFTKEKYNISFEKGEPNVTNINVDFSLLLDNDVKRQNFDSFFESLSF
ncbi:MAG: Panacea domain-containing protein [Bacteroidia bacterium]|jgi:uncharacterized phage-associated protein|nr:Panacea domain-containing protein [Bacteroidia bacterium]